MRKWDSSRRRLTPMHLQACNLWRTRGVNHGQNYGQLHWIWLVSSTSCTPQSSSVWFTLIHPAQVNISSIKAEERRVSGLRRPSISAPPILLQQTSWRRDREKNANCSHPAKKRNKKIRWAFDTLSLKEKYINDAPWQSALISEGSPWTPLFIGHRFSSGFMASDTPRTLVAGRLLGNTLRGCHLSRHASCIIL